MEKKKQVCLWHTERFKVIQVVQNGPVEMFKCFKDAKSELKCGIKPVAKSVQHPSLRSNLVPRYARKLQDT